MKTVDQLTELFRQQGLRVTPQRQAIFGLLHGDDRHPTVESMYDAARAQMPTISLKTVYQTVNDLAAMGEVVLLDLGTGSYRVDPNVEDESQLPGAREGHLGQLFREAGLREVEEGSLSVDVEHPTFEEWWAPYTLGVGPAGAYVAGLEQDRQSELRERCRELLPEAPFVVSARAWAARGVA